MNASCDINKIHSLDFSFNFNILSFYINFFNLLFTLLKVDTRTFRMPGKNKEATKPTAHNTNILY